MDSQPPGSSSLRRPFQVPENRSGKDLILNLGPIDDADTTFVNGVKVGDFPFLIVQLTNFRKAVPALAKSNWAELREAQLQVAETVPNSGLAVAIDIGDGENIHPKNKKEVGRRLAMAALGKVCGKEIEYSGPLYQPMSVEGATIRMKFTHGAGLRAKDGPLKQFAIAGADGRFVWADNPEGCNLYNEADLPASPFRTDPR